MAFQVIMNYCLLIFPFPTSLKCLPSSQTYISSSVEQHLYESGFGIRIPDPDPGIRTWRRNAILSGIRFDNGRHLVRLTTIKATSAQGAPFTFRTMLARFRQWCGSGSSIDPNPLAIYYIGKKQKLISNIWFFFTTYADIGGQIRSQNRSCIMLVRFRYGKLMRLRFWLWHLSFGLCTVQHCTVVKKW
jgi:hypothetical protein